MGSILLVEVRKKVSWGDIFWKTTRWMLVFPDLKKDDFKVAFLLGCTEQ